MRAKSRKYHKLLTAVIMSASLVAPQLSLAQAAPADQDPSMLAMTTDLVVVRPALFAITTVGAVIYVVSLPFTLAGGNTKQAGKVLVAGPAVATFVRCLGCTKSGHKRN